MQIARDAVILPGCFLQGHTVIGEAAEVGPYTTLIGATIDAEAHVERSRVQETHIGRAANIGPWTYLRPGNELGEGSKAGAFVEMKKAHIGNGTKVPHLSYVATPTWASTPTSAAAPSPPTMTACTSTTPPSDRTCMSARATCSSPPSPSATASPPEPAPWSATTSRPTPWSIPKTRNT